VFRKLISSINHFTATHAPAQCCYSSFWWRQTTRHSSTKWFLYQWWQYSCGFILGVYLQFPIVSFQQFVTVAVTVSSGKLKTAEINGHKMNFSEEQWILSLQC